MELVREVEHKFLMSCNDQDFPKVLVKFDG